MSTIEKVWTRALAELSFAARRRILDEFTTRRSRMANSETPGHAEWYPTLLEEEREAATLLFPKNHELHRKIEAMLLSSK